MSYGTTLAGRGRWTTIMRPSIGILWTDDHNALGFHQTSNVDVDPTPVQVLIDNAHAAGKTPTQAFDELALAIGTHIDTGTLLGDRGQFIADRGSLRRHLAQPTTGTLGMSNG